MSPPNTIFASLAVSFAVVALGLVSAWADWTPKAQLKWYQPYTAPYLGAPIWMKNPFAWHPVLMVAGFFLSQVFSLSSIVLFGNKTHAAFSHVFWQTAALCTLIAGLRAIVKFKYLSHENSLVSLHSWIGVLTVIAFTFSYLVSNAVGISSLIGNRLNLTWTHMLLSITTLALSFITIVSGVQVYNQEHGCDFLKANPDHTALNSAFYYGARLPWSCKLSNGIGLTVMFATATTVLALVASRSVALIESEEPAEAVEEKGVELVVGNEA